MPEEATDAWWQNWLETEIAECERDLILAPPHEKFEIWRRLDLLHALRGAPWAADRRPAAPPPEGTLRPARRLRLADSLVFAGGVLLGTALAWLIGAGLGLAS